VTWCPLPFYSNQSTLRHSTRRVRASHSDVVDLAVQKNDLPVDRTSVDTSRQCDVHDIEVVEDLVDVLFPHIAPASGCPCKALSSSSNNEWSTSYPW
jgi:hypothetical protein